MYRHPYNDNLLKQISGVSQGWEGNTETIASYIVHTAHLYSYVASYKVQPNL